MSERWGNVRRWRYCFSSRAVPRAATSRHSVRTPTPDQIAEVPHREWGRSAADRLPRAPLGRLLVDSDLIHLY